jgi:hypothetical protein
MADQHSYNVSMLNGKEKTVRAVTYTHDEHVVRFWSDARPGTSGEMIPMGALTASFNAAEVASVVRED